MYLFGKELFSRGPKVLYDFNQHGLVGRNEFMYMQPVAEWGTLTTSTTGDNSIPPSPPKEETLKITPKGIYALGSLNDNDFTINVDPKYLDTQIDLLKKKSNIVFKGKLPKPNSRRTQPIGGGNYFGKLEIESMIERLNNRKKINEVKKTLDKYPHTTSKLIEAVLKENKHLRLEPATAFVPDLPDEAINAMEEYNRMCKKLCDKESVFYIIGEKEDFEIKNKRRDPILLAQSPFGFFWQVLGAWDDEIKYLDEL